MNIYVNGEEVTALGTIEYGQTTGRVELPAPGTYDIGVGLPGGDGPLVQLSGVELADGDDVAAAAYRTNEALPVALFAYNLSTDGLDSGSGRVFVSHGANDPALNPVDIILTDEGACPEPLLDDLAFGETRVEGGLDLPAASYNLGFDLAPGDCTAEVPFVAPVTEAVTSVLVAVDEDTGAGLAPQVWALVDAETVVALINPDPCDGVVCNATDCTEGVCNPDTGLCEDDNVNEGGDCDGGTGTCDMGICVANCEGVVCEEAEVCQVSGCNPFSGLCETMNEEDGAECSCPTCGTAGICEAGICVPNAEVVYEQNFDTLDITAPDALSQDGWLVFGNVFDTNDVFLFPYGPFGAPNGGQGFSAIVDDQGGPGQEPQQLSIYNDYGCCQPSNGHFNGTDLVESLVFQEPYPNVPGETIPAGDIGKTLTFSFDAKNGSLAPPTTALAYIQTLDPSAGFNRTNFVTIDLTSIGTTWGRYEISLDLTDPLLIGQVLQFGFQSKTSNFADSQNVYDNILVTLSPTP